MMYQTETRLRNGFCCRPALLCLSVLYLFALAATAFAATDSSSNNDAYVDSVYSWGAWELGIEPASGPQAPANNALNSRALTLKFRPNDNAAYKIQSVAVQPVTTITPPPPVPVIPPPSGPPAPPTVMPIGPGVPPPVGSPGGS